MTQDNMKPAKAPPIPTSISDEAQAVMQALIDENGVPRNASHGLPSPDDHDAWMSLRQGADAAYARRFPDHQLPPRMRVATVAVESATVHVARSAAADAGSRTIVDLHGGAFVFGGGAASRASATEQAELNKGICYGVDYRMPPEHPFPAALDDCLAVYRHVLRGTPPDQVVVIGRSAGGNLALAMALRARDEGLPVPGGLVLLSPEVDLTESGDSFRTNRMADLVLPMSLMQANLLYAGSRELDEPYVSPLFAELHGMPPTFIQSGTRDLFLSNAVRLHRRLLQSNVSAELHIFEGMPHGGFSGTTPEDLDLKQEVARFASRVWERTRT